MSWRGRKLAHSGGTCSRDSLKMTAAIGKTEGKTEDAMVSNDAKIDTSLEAVMQIRRRQSAGAAVLIVDKAKR